MRELRGVWLANHPHSQVLASRKNMAEALDFLRASGFNTIFPVVWNRGHTLYPSQVMARYGLAAQEAFYNSRDPLAEIVALAQQRQIKVIPWLEYGFAASHLESGGHILKQYPHWQGQNYDGSRLKHGGLVWMNGFHPEVQQFMLELIREIVGNYQVDGVQGCDRLPAMPVTGSYDPFTAEQYQRAWGVPPPRNHFQRQWMQWRASLLTDFLRKMYQQVKQIRPDALVSLSPAVYPFGYQNLLQDYPTWLTQGLCDLVHPQIYRANYGRYRHEVKQITKTSSRTLLPKFAPGIALTANGHDLKPQDLVKFIRLNRQHNFVGQVLFHYEGLRKNQNAVAQALVTSGGYDQEAAFPVVASS